MAIPENRIQSRNKRLSLAKVYGVNPFDVVRQLNKPLEGVLAKLVDTRTALSSIKDKIDSARDNARGLSGAFDINSLKNTLLDMLGVNVFKRTIANIKQELKAIADLLGIKTKTAITNTANQLEITPTLIDDVKLVLGIPVDPATNEATYAVPAPTVVTPTTSTDLPTSPTVPVTPTVPTTLELTCKLPSIGVDSTLTTALGLTPQATTPIVVPVVVTPTASTASTSTTTTVSYPVLSASEALSTLVGIAIVAVQLNDYTGIATLPPSLQSIVANLLVAMGLETNNVDAAMAGLQYGDIPQLLETYPGVLEWILAHSGDITTLVGILNSKLTLDQLIALSLPQYLLDILVGLLPLPTTVSPVPISEVVQGIVIAATVIPSKVRRYQRTNYLHTYYPVLV